MPLKALFLVTNKSLSVVCHGRLSWDLGLKSHPEEWRSMGSN